MNPVELRIKRLDDRASLPGYHSELAAGLDLAACLDEPMTVHPGEIVRVATGLALAIPAGFEGQVRPRSGLAAKHGVTVVNTPGTIDADYRGQLFVALVNLGKEPYTIEHGSRIAQLVIAPVAHATVIEADELDDTKRGDGGFGSTGGH